jgi:hypothetical protein
VELHPTKKLLHSKGSSQQNETITTDWEKNICKPYEIKGYYPKFIKNSYN